MQSAAGHSRLSWAEGQGQLEQTLYLECQGTVEAAEGSEARESLVDVSALDRGAECKRHLLFT